MQNKRDLPKNDIPLLILAVLLDAPRHGYAIAREVERLSADALQMREGTLYPALRVLEQDGLISGAWEIQPVGPARKIYTLTETGQAELKKRTQDWENYARIMGAVLGLGRNKGGLNEQPA